MSGLPCLDLSRSFSECMSAAGAATPAASWKDDQDVVEDGILPPTDTVEDELHLLQDVIDEFFVRMRALLVKLEKRTTA